MNMHRNAIDRHRMRHSRLSWAIVAGLAAQQAMPAFAQQSTAAEQAQSVKELDTIVVTAQGREQDILAVPYNISAVSGEAIEQGNILDTAELMRGVAGVGVVDRGARNSSVVSGIRIRGLNVDSSALGDYAVSASATVATYVDNTPLFANFLLSDIDRVEVLRGPQGTLYGSGAIGGAVRYILRQPEIGQWDARVSMSASSVSGSDSIGLSQSIMANIPLADTVALRINGTHNDFPGVTDYRNVYKLDANGLPVAPKGVLDPAAVYENVRDADFVRQTYGRAALLWRPNDAFDMTLSYTAQDDVFGGRRGTSLGSDGWGVPYRDNEIGSVQLEPSDRRVHLAALEANVDLGFATLTSSTSQYDHQGDIVSENTGFYAKSGWLTAAVYYNYPRPMASAVRSYSDEAFIQEFRLVSKPGEVLDYVLGAYYQDQKRRSGQDSFLRGFKRWTEAAWGPGYVIDDQDFYYRTNERFKETALHGELTWHASPTVDLTGGFRLFRDTTITDMSQVTGLWATFRETSQTQAREKDTRSLFKGTVSWRFSENNQFYGTVSEGYRRGGINSVPTTGLFAEDPDAIPYQADTVRNYEAGVKGRVGHLTYNADVFYVDWKDPQINSATYNWGFFAVLNAEKASTRGVELELAGVLDNGFAYSAGYAYTEARIDADLQLPGYPAGVALPGKGFPLPGAPEHRLNASGSYTIPIGRDWLVLRADAYYQSQTENALSVSPKYRDTLDGFAIFNASATYSHGNWDTTLWLKNIANEAGVTGVYKEEYMGTVPAVGYYGNGSKALTALGRTLGLTVSYRF